MAVQKTLLFHIFHPVHFLLWGFEKDTVYRPPLPHNLQELRQRIITLVTAIGEDLLEKVWQELGYRIDVCHVTRGATYRAFITLKLKTLRVSLAIVSCHMIVCSLIIFSQTYDNVPLFLNCPV
jgi:hypothetical protein